MLVSRRKPITAPKVSLVSNISANVHFPPTFLISRSHLFLAVSKDTHSNKICRRVSCTPSWFASSSSLSTPSDSLHPRAQNPLPSRKIRCLQDGVFTTPSLIRTKNTSLSLCFQMILPLLSRGSTLYRY